MSKALQATAESVADAIRDVEPELAESLTVSPAVVTAIYREQERQAGRSVEAFAVAAEWTWESRTRGPRTLAVTLIEVTSAWLGADGEAVREVFICHGRLNTDEASTLARLAASNAMPRRITWEEL